MIRHIPIALVFGVSILSAEEDFESRKYQSGGKHSLHYRIHSPGDTDSGKQYPLILFLHGAGERGDDNRRQLRHGVADMLAYSRETGNPAIIIAPQCPRGKQWVETPWGADSHSMPKEPSVPMRMTIELLERTMSELPVDRKRVYVTGLSMGGFGTWDIIQRHPDIFAAAIPICGGGDTRMAPAIKGISIWAFHGGEDKTVKTKRSRDMIDSIRKSGGSPNYTEYEGVGHNSWKRTYSNREVLKWLFDQSRRSE